MNKTAFSSILLQNALGLLLAVCPALVLVIQGYFAASGIVYTLDDPYIHLTLARQIWRGEYGINPGEFSAPSSSILWPFLFAPFSSAACFELLPLVVNFASLTITLWWIQRWLRLHASVPWMLLATVLVAFCFNLYGPPLSGMEHSLQVMLVVIVALSLVQGPLNWPFWLSLIVLPFIRYEGLAISLPTAAYLLTPAHRVKAAASAFAIVLGVGGFSFFLYRNGVGLLPAAVIVRDGLDTEFGPFWTVSRAINNAQDQLYFVALAAFAGFLLVREKKWGAAMLLMAAPTAGHIVFGKYGDVSRYQIYFEVWVAIHFFSVYRRSAMAQSLPLNIALAAGLLAGTTDAMMNTLAGSLASRNIADQNKQMAQVARDYIDEPIAVQDLGLVSLYSRRYVLDIVGLASYEALKLQSDPAQDVWLAELMHRHGVEHAMLYAREWSLRPANWIHVADLNLPMPCITPGSSDHVSFYSTSPQAAARLREALTNYRRDSREGAMMLEMVAPPVGGQNAASRTATEDACDTYEDTFNSNVLAQAIRFARHRARLGLDALLASYARAKT